MRMIEIKDTIFNWREEEDSPNLLTTKARELSKMVIVRKAPILHHFSSESIVWATTIPCSSYGDEKQLSYRYGRKPIIITGFISVVAFNTLFGLSTNLWMAMSAFIVIGCHWCIGEIHPVMNPNPYRGPFGSNANTYVKEFQDHIDYGTSGKVAGFIAETTQGVGGAVEPVSDYLKHVYDIVRKAGGVCIADEVQIGFDRTRSYYWGLETQGVIPDIVTMVKGIGNGYPLAAVATTPEIASVMAQKTHLNTYGRNPISSAAGLAVLKVLDNEKCQANCDDVGSHLLEHLRSLQQRHDIIGDVRGRGLMLGVKLVTDRTNKTPTKAETAVLLEKLRELGILIGKGGLHGNVFGIKPPMCFNKDDADFLVDALDYSMTKL